MKTIFLSVLAVLAASVLSAQTQINKTIPVSPGQTLEMHFDYPNLVRVSTWDKSEISVQGTVSINGGENDDAFELQTSATGDRISIRNEIRNMKDLPHRITVKRDGQTLVFRTKAEFQKYRKENGQGFDMYSDGLDLQIHLEIKVPKGIRTRVEAVYGMVEVVDFNGPLVVEATYGGVDAAVAERTTGELSASTNYGQIYSNLTVKLGGAGSREENFHTYVTAKPGTGPVYSFESKYGNVYLRKPPGQ